MQFGWMFFTYSRHNDSTDADGTDIWDKCTYPINQFSWYLIKYYPILFFKRFHGKHACDVTENWLLIKTQVMIMQVLATCFLC